ncbi:MAG: FAD-dependent monooxygenase [Clostridia bacterium]|nr:FAD-dependent monooxygenase [Clostridia bacterium]
MLKLSNVRIPVNHSPDYGIYAASVLGISSDEVLSCIILRKSLDARRRGNVAYICSFSVRVEDEQRFLGIENVSLFEDRAYKFEYRNLRSDARPVIIGTGPAGLFCALMLARAGLRPIVFDRGEPVEKRTQTVNLLREKGILNVNSNVQFGEGGAGTFSDGKLTCGVNDPRIDFVLSEFAKAGAPAEILYLAKPHIGTDYLRTVVCNMRKEIVFLGGEVNFDSCFTDFMQEDGAVTGAEITNVITGEKRYIDCSTLVIAPGHSSRDTYELLYRRGLTMTKKAFSVGVRIEHPRKYINMLRYKDANLAETLPAADYKLNCSPQGRGVYTFCMCPGGEVVCGSSEEGGVVTNGMSYFARNMDNSNSALLVSVRPEDIPGDSPLSGIEFQRTMEHAAYKLGGGGYKAPCQRVADFLKGDATRCAGIVKPSYKPGVSFADIDGILPDFVAKSLKQALVELDRKMHGFLMEDALLTGVETRSSAPLRIVRDEEMMSSVKGIYPIGEGAGYAGGIMSAAMDGIKCAEKIVNKL